MIRRITLSLPDTHVIYRHSFCKRELDILEEQEEEGMEGQEMEEKDWWSRNWLERPWIPR